MKEDDDRETALHCTSKEGHKEIVKLLLGVFIEDEPEKLIDSPRHIVHK